MRIDLGCGINKFPGCIGIDCMPYDDVEVIHDLNHPLPLEDDSVDFLIASHSLQYVSDLEHIMREIYRVCKHESIVCIVAPYAHFTTHMANPHYKQQFNEHSPRYWTGHNQRIVNEDEYLLSSPEPWSLAEPFPSAISMDLRLLRMEFFYLPQYHAYDDLERQLLRQTQMNVAYQIMYHLLVVKHPIPEEQVWMWSSRELEEPQYVKDQRQSFAKDQDWERWIQTEHLSPLLDLAQTKPPDSESGKIYRNDNSILSTLAHSSPSRVSLPTVNPEALLKKKKSTQKPNKNKNSPSTKTSIKNKRSSSSSASLSKRTRKKKPGR